MPTQTAADGHMQVWQVNAKASREIYEDEIEELKAAPRSAEAVAALELARGRLAEAKTTGAPREGFWARTGGRVGESWAGTGQEETWRAIHEADSVLTYARSAEHIRAELPALRQTVRLRVDDEIYKQDLLERLKKVEKSLDDQVDHTPKAPRGGGPNGGPAIQRALTISGADREAVTHAKQEVYKLSAEGYESQRGFRNVIVIAFVAAVLAAAALAILGLFDNTIQYRLDLYPKTGRLLWPDAIWPVELMGALAGFIVAVGALRRLPGHGPYPLHFWQAALRVPLGALTALAGLLVVQSGTFGIGPLTTKGAFVGWAFLFGASQELITRLVDQKAAEVAEKAKPSG